MLSGVSCSCETSTRPLGDPNRHEPALSPRSLDQFWRDFQSALRRNDVSEIAKLTRFPIEVNLADLEGFEGIGNREGFVRHFKTIFPEQAIRTLLNETPQPRDPVGVLRDKATESWSISHNEPNKVSELEWSIIYCFSRFSDGSIRMTTIDFAG